MTGIRAAAVAGTFYPGEAVILRRVLAQMLDSAPPPTLTPKALIVPHAGYVYSGPIAASAYAALKRLRQRVRRVLLLGPAHRVWVPGLALPGAEGFATPLGTVQLDLEAMAGLDRFAQVRNYPAAHAHEHALEVQLPFLLSVLEDFRLVPLVVGGASAREVAEVIEALWGGDETLVVVSSDLSHYHPYDEARAIDQATVTGILDGRSDLLGEQACGAAAINGLNLAARHKGLRAQLLDLRNSGDTAGDRARVVGYAALAYGEAEHAPRH